MLLPYIYIKPGDEIKKSFKWKDQGECTQVAKVFWSKKWINKVCGEAFDNKNWKSAWLILLPDKNLCYTIKRILWQIPKKNPLARLPSYQ